MSTDPSPLAAWGIPGFIIVVLAGVILYLYRDGRTKDKQLIDLQEARLLDAKEFANQVVSLIEPLGKYAKLTYDKLKSSKGQ